MSACWQTCARSAGTETYTEKYVEVTSQDIQWNILTGTARHVSAGNSHAQ